MKKPSHQHTMINSASELLMKNDEHRNPWLRRQVTLCPPQLQYASSNEQGRVYAAKIEAASSWPSGIEVQVMPCEALHDASENIFGIGN
jgi:hypothetical protein